MKDGGQWTGVGDRVRECRLAADMSQEQIASAMNLDRTMIAKIETGVRRIDALELAKLSAILKVPLSYFLSSPPTVVSRRTELADDTVTDATRQSYRLEIALSTWLSDVQQLIELGELAAPRIERYPETVEDTLGARSAASWARGRLNLGLDPIDSMMAVCERLGQLVAIVETPGDGASLVEDDIAVAVVSSNGDPGRRRATAAHELGHLIIGDEYSSDIGVHSSRAERESIIDSFSAELLLPIDAFTERLPAGPTTKRDVLITFAAKYHTSWSLTLRQATEAGLIDRDTAKTLRQRNPTRAELMEAVDWAPQPDLEAVLVPPRYAHAVLQSFKNGLITTSRAVEMMRGQVSAADLPARDYPDLEP
ncbi:XRE family transcriptional regulator [Nonomuraea sp. NPDC052129]|uniref:helix-turn-helix domain-containing protein n=1 Tax=Nonomuraea sp. NPDC052129 TaxID=3154651 RepID=UPI003445F46B